MLIVQKDINADFVLNNVHSWKHHEPIIKQTVILEYEIEDYFEGVSGNYYSINET